MCHDATRRSRRVRQAVLAWSFFVFEGAVFAQAVNVVAGALPEWRHVGNSGIDLSLASPATGPVNRVWFSADGSALFARTHSGRVFSTADFQQWQPDSTATPATDPPAVGALLPLSAKQLRPVPFSSRSYAFGDQVLRSDDRGASWTNLTEFEGSSIIGGQIADLAVSPQDPDVIVVANAFGVWRSADGGVSWTGLNDALPNLPAKRLLALPQGSHGVTAAVDGAGAIEWPPGERQAWQPASGEAASREGVLRNSASASLGAEISAAVAAGDTVYAGSVDGRLWTSPDQGRTWIASPHTAQGRIEGFFPDPNDARFVLAAVGGDKGPHVLRTINAGQFWEDVTGNLPDVPAYGVTADRPSGTLYVATARGVFMGNAGWLATGPVDGWNLLSGLPDAPVLDIKLDADGNQLFVLVEGYGVYAAAAPHLANNPSIVSSADLRPRPAAPGSLMTVLGERVTAAHAGGLNVPILTATNGQSQIQIPFSAKGSSVALALDTAGGSTLFAVPMETVSPALSVDRDGTPLVLNADTGGLSDTTSPVHSNGRLQVLATGLGAVNPPWPAGVAAPAANPPAVAAPVHAYLNGSDLGSVHATLAPGYVGLYVVEVQLPALADTGPAELYIEAGNTASNRIRIWIEP